MSITNFQEKHSKVWEKIFQNQLWTSIASSHGLNPALVGQDLYTIYDDKHEVQTPPAYIVLIIGDKTGDIRFHSKAFLNSLRPHVFYESSNEVFLKNSNITLNIYDALETPHFSLIDPEKVFSFRVERLHSAYLFWQDGHYALGVFSPADITGIGGKVSVLKDVAAMCGLILLPSQDAGCEIQQAFSSREISRVSMGPLGRIGHIYNGDDCLEWKWAKQITPKKIRPLSYIEEEE